MDPKQSDECFNATVLFCDVRGFTQLFDDRDPLEALSFAKTVLGRLGSVVEECTGTIDKFTGDGFLAHFGIKTATVKHADEACWCALEIRAALSKINTFRYMVDQPIISTGIGIHSGTIAAGTISTNHKSEYTILGSTVNLAARIEGLTKFFSVDCLISDETAALLTDPFQLKKMGKVPVRGLSKEIVTNWLLPTNNLEDRKKN